MCGAYFGVSGNPGITVYSTKLPFQLLVNFDGTEVESFNRYLQYLQIYLYLSSTFISTLGGTRHNNY